VNIVTPSYIFIGPSAVLMMVNNLSAVPMFYKECLCRHLKHSSSHLLIIERYLKKV